MFIRIVTLSVLVIGSSFGLYATEQQQPQAQAGTAKSASASLTMDEAFIRSAIASNRFELQLGRLGTERATDSKVREFAEHIVQDHSQALRKFEQVAKDNKIAMPDEVNPAHKDVLNVLSSLRGREFDQKFMQVMTKQHAIEVMEFRDQAAYADDPDVRRLARSILPKLNDHFEMAQNIRRSQLDQAASARGAQPRDASARRFETGVNQGSTSRQQNKR